MTSVISATVSANAQSSSNVNNIDWNMLFSHPLTIAIVSSGVVGLIFVAFLKFVYKMGETNINFKNALIDLGKLKSGIENIQHCILEIQATLKSRFKITWQHNIAINYGQAHSPIVLRDEFKRFIIESKLDKQIENKKNQLIDWLKKEKPATGLDAQDDISNFVLSNKVSQYLDLKEYKQNLYKNGKTSEDAAGILTVFLFEVLIPELHIPEENEKTTNKRKKTS